MKTQHLPLIILASAALTLASCQEASRVDDDTSQPGSTETGDTTKGTGSPSTDDDTTEGTGSTSTDDDTTPSEFEDCEPAFKTEGCFTIDESRIRTLIEGGSLRLGLVLEPKSSPENATLDLKVRDLDGAEIVSYVESIDASDKSVEVWAEMDASVGDETIELADYVLDYELTCASGVTTGRYSLFQAAPKTQIIMRGPDDFILGTTNGMRLYAQDPVTMEPKSGVQLDLYLVYEENGAEKRALLDSGQTGDEGTYNAELPLGDDLPETGRLEVEATDDGAKQVLTAFINLTRPQSLLITTDKPIYQPGQTIHIRSLALRRPDMVPEAGTDVTIEVLDAKGNKVFKEVGVCDAFGIASAQFRLASEVILGDYTVKVHVGDTVSEKTVKVDRYTLPKYDLDVATDKAFYKPGETLRGTLSAMYFFGKAVAGADVVVQAWKYDVELTAFSEVTGQTDENGNFEFEMPLPTSFIGTELDRGNAFVLLTVEVTDPAGQKRSVELSRPVVETPVLLQIVPESGDVVPGVQNRFYVIATDPQGKPVSQAFQVTPPGTDAFSVTTNAAGIAWFDLDIPQSAESILLRATSAEIGTQTFSFTPGQSGAFVLLRTDQPVYTVGDTVEVDVLCPDYENAALAFKDRVYLDIIKDGRTALMTTVELEQGVGHYAFEITPELVGGFELEAYYLAADSSIMRDRKLVYADPADKLRIDITQDSEIYAPADDAKLTFTVTDSQGLPVPSAIGLQIVDEAVYSLMEFRPGLEKVFYAIEEEILSPKYEIHGYDLDDVVNGEEIGLDEEQRKEAAEVLFAAGEGGSFGVSQDSYKTMQSEAAARAKVAFQAAVNAIRDEIEDLCSYGDLYDNDHVSHYLEDKKNCWLDPWNNLISVENVDWSTWSFGSAGLDETSGTSDDLSYTVEIWCGSGWGGTDSADVPADDDWDAGGGEGEAEGEGEGEGGGDGSGPRVRRNFPETLYVNPALITDASGKAQLTVPLADSITTWRLGALASSKGGLLGSAEHGITVFQDFFVDIDVPAQLTQEDEVAVPVAIYNYLDEAQSVTLSIVEQDWFELVDTADKTVELGPGEVAGVSYRIRAKDVGWQALTVYGYGTQLSDAVERKVEVVPDGKQIDDSVSGRLDGAVEHVAVFPEDAIPGANRLLVKIYPGMMSQAVEGLDSMLQMPSGCFEQTSSSTYPNVLVLDYLMRSGTVTPEIELKAREYINLGYQRLLTFEVDGGGFEWFGNAPAHNILTAYGLLEFFDMAKVHPVDPAIIERTQAWLVGQQQSDGHFEPTHGGIAEGAINNYQDDVARTTAYLTYALAETGYDKGALSAGINWLKGHQSEVTDAYGLAMVANAFVAADDPAAAGVLGKLHDMRVEEDGLVHWTGTGESTTYGTGDVMTLETTALAALAMLRAGVHSTDVSGAVDFLLTKKDSLGNWSTTQATIQTLRLLIAMMENSAQPGPATVRIYAHDTLQETLNITAQTSDVLRMVDLSGVIATGNTPVRIEIDGESSYMYQVISRYFVPWGGGEGTPGEGPVSIDVEYDKTTLAVDELVTATATIASTVPGAMAKMVLVDLGLPPGFDLVTDNLQAAVEAGVLKKFEKTQRQLTLYIEQVTYGQPVVVSYGLRAKYPLTASSGEAEVHPYYDPDASSQDEPTEFVVTE